MLTPPILINIPLTPRTPLRDPPNRLPALLISEILPSLHPLIIFFAVLAGVPWYVVLCAGYESAGAADGYGLFGG